MESVDKMLFPANDIFDLAELLANLSDAGFESLQSTLEKDYGFRLEKKHTNRHEK